MSALDELLEWNPLAARDSVLELDCGRGEMLFALARRLPDAMLVGMDTSEDSVRIARRAALEFDNCMLVTGDGQEIPWQDEVFHLVLAHHLPENLPECLRVLAAQGSIVVLIQPDDREAARMAEDALAACGLDADTRAGQETWAVRGRKSKPNHG